jgi:hypothetical protein
LTAGFGVGAIVADAADELNGVHAYLECFSLVLNEFPGAMIGEVT